MTTKELAMTLNGREYGEELTSAEKWTAAASGLVVVFGYSDDNAEFRGAIDEECSCYDGGTFYLDEDGIVEVDCDNEDCKLLKKYLAGCKTIEAVCGKGDYMWTYKTDIPHETFEIFEDGERYCRGIVFEIAALKG
jgi:hypothetical protein